MTDQTDPLVSPNVPQERGGFFGAALLSRAARGSTWTVLAFVITQGARFGANLILTRLLFPEAFGIMALITVLLVGLSLFSDMGINQSVIQSKRGDEPDFLDTAWTLQILRGVLLWLAACALAYPAALFYEQPIIAQALPVAGLALLFAGFEPMRVDTENRHLRLGRVTLLDVTSFLIGLVFIIVTAWITKSVWALVLGWTVTAALRLVFMWVFLPGRGNRLFFEKPAVLDILLYGFWIFLSSICGFLVVQGDKAILGKFLTIDALGIYNIGMFLATVPLILGTTVTTRILIPLYRELLEDSDSPARARLFRLRYGLTGALLLALFVLALIGPWLVNVLYDERYLAAGGVMVGIATLQMIAVVSLTYDQAALATGDSRGFFFVTLFKAVIQMSGFLMGVIAYGLAGALIGWAVAMLIYHPAVALLARQHRAWDGWHDLLFLPLVLVLVAVAIWVHWSDVQYLIPGTPGGLNLR